MGTLIGVVPRQRREPSALCVVEGRERRREDRRLEEHYMVRHLERLPAGSAFPELARRAGEVVAGVHRRTGDIPAVYVDATGLGEPVAELVRVECPAGWVRAVYFNHGDRRSVDGEKILLGKGWTVARLQTLLQAGHLHLPRTPQAEDLARDLLDYEIKVTEDANDRYGAFRVGVHDDLVTALGLAVQEPPARFEYLG